MHCFLQSGYSFHGYYHLFVVTEGTLKGELEEMLQDSTSDKELLAVFRLA